jgi:4-amino-4-deoxy-L-arabinose transferase-like glycosyltransferase
VSALETAVTRPPRTPRLHPAPSASTGDAARDRRWTCFVLAASLVLALAMRLPYLNVPLGPDEGGLSFIARQWGSGHGSLYGAYWVDRPPFLLGLFKLAVLDGAIGVRILGAVAALALVTVTSLAAGALAGHRAARIAALLSAVFTGSVALAATGTPSELLAAVPAAASVGCLIAAHRRQQSRWLVAAGACALTAPLVKQSFLDAGAAGAVFLVASAIHAPRRLPRNAIAYAAGALIPLAALAVVLWMARISAGDLAYALFGFRVDGLRTLAASSVPLQQRVAGLELPALGSGLVVALVVTPLALWRLRRDAVLAVTLGAWLVAGVVGVLLGGSYWPHYLIQLAAPAAVLAAAALARARLGMRFVTVVAAAAIGIGFTAAGVPRIHRQPPRQAVLTVARYLRGHARPGDTDYVMYAKANLDYYAGLPSPYPYAWSLMVRTIPTARSRLDHLLESSRRPTWVVGWERPDTWGMDPHGVTQRLLHDHYRQAAKVGGHRIYLRRDRAPGPRGVLTTPGRHT